MNTKHTIKKVTKVLSMKENNFKPAKYILWKATVGKIVKYFVTKKDALAFVKSMFDTTPINLNIVK